jgi:hypothetical protein
VSDDHRCHQDDLFHGRRAVLGHSRAYDDAGYGHGTTRTKNGLSVVTTLKTIELAGAYGYVVVGFFTAVYASKVRCIDIMTGFFIALYWPISLPAVAITHYQRRNADPDEISFSWWQTPIVWAFLYPTSLLVGGYIAYSYH